MALSGSFTGTTANEYIVPTIIWSATQSVSGNYSMVTAELRYSRTNSYTTYGDWYGSITINGTKVPSTEVDNDGWIHITISKNSNTLAMKTPAIKVPHSSDGTKKITISAVGRISGTTLESTSISSTVTLDTIPRASSITSASAVTLDNKCSIKWTPLASSFVYKVKLSCGGVTHTSDYIEPGSTSAYTYSATMSISYWAKAMPKAYSGTCTATLYTYTSSSSTSAIGSDSATFTLTLPSSIKPTVSFATPTLINGWNGYYIQGKSKCTLSATFAAGTGSSITSCSISGTGLSKTGTGTSLSGTTNILTKSGTITYTAKITDGRTSVSTTKSIYVYPYTSPILSLSAARTSANGSVKITYKASCSSIKSENNLDTLKVYKKKSTDSTWPLDAEKTVTLSGTSVSDSITLSGFESASSYDFKAIVTDTYGSSSAAATASVASEFRILNINANKTGIAFGKMSESNNLFECGLPTQFNKNVVTNGGFGCSNNYDAGNFAMYCQWADGENHDMIVRNDDGVTMGLGWTGSGTHETTLDVRPSNVNVRGVMTAPRGIFTATEDASPTEQNDVPLRIGTASAEHIDIDKNEIIAKDNATTVGTLALSGANVDIYSGATLTFRVSKDETSEHIKSMPTYTRTYDGSPNMYITSNGVFGRGTSSSQRYKTEIDDVVDDKLNPYNVLNIPVRQFKYNKDNVPINKNKDDLYIGFVAEEVEAAYPIAAEYNENGQVEMWNIKVLFPALLKVVQDQQKEIESLKKVINNIANASSNNME